MFCEGRRARSGSAERQVWATTALTRRVVANARRAPSRPARPRCGRTQRSPYTPKPRGPLGPTPPTVPDRPSSSLGRTSRNIPAAQSPRAHNARSGVSSQTRLVSRARTECRADGTVEPSAIGTPMLPRGAPERAAAMAGQTAPQRRSGDLFLPFCTWRPTRSGNGVAQGRSGSLGVRT